MRIIYNSKSFRNYLNKFVFDEKPFGCANLKVLPESLEVRENDSALVYEKGALVCYAKLGSIGITKSHKCSAGEFKINEERNLELVCDWNGGKFVLKLKK
ncbi:MAG: hypothetical protein KKB25_00605 [Nanoarchaeota archaeon]|nr:hypothetical protein [Nanoarchaeota archaeon]